MLKLRRMLPALLMIGVVALGGCVYLRLLQFKKQFRDFHENFEIRSDGHYALIIKKPLLGGDDVDFVMKALPSETEAREGEILSRTYTFHLDDGSQDPRARLEYELRFESDLFVEMHFPEEFSTLFPEDALRELLSSLGDAETDRRSEGMRARLRKNRVRELMPNRARVLEALGEASHRWREKDGLERLLYRYDLETESSHLEPHKRRAFGRFHFEGETLIKVDASFGGHVFSFEIP